MKPARPHISLAPWMAALIALFLSICALTANAQTDAYSIEVAVSERDDDEQKDAYAAGLRRILLNNSGDKTILNRDLIRQALEQAENYVQAFSFRRPPPGTAISSDTPITRSVQQTGQATQLMLVSFDRTLVNELIENSAPSPSSASTDVDPDPAPIASNSALVWLLISDDDRDIFISDEIAQNVQKRAREIAGAAGISLRYPTGDEEDQQLISSDDLMAQVFDEQSVASALDRYAQDTVLFGYMTRMGARGWRSQWTRYSGEQAQQEQFETSSLDEGLQQGLGILGSVSDVDESYRYGGTATSDTEGLVWVGSLDSTEDYARMIRFLENVEGVSSVYPKEVQASSMVFSVIPRSALLAIESATSDVTWLQRTAPPLVEDANSLVSDADLAIEYQR